MFLKQGFLIMIPAMKTIFLFYIFRVGFLRIRFVFVIYFSHYDFFHVENPFLRENHHENGLKFHSFILGLKFSWWLIMLRKYEKQKLKDQHVAPTELHKRGYLNLPSSALLIKAYKHTAPNRAK